MNPHTLTLSNPLAELAANSETKVILVPMGPQPVLIPDGEMQRLQFANRVMERCPYQPGDMLKISTCDVCQGRWMGEFCIACIGKVSTITRGPVVIVEYLNLDIFDASHEDLREVFGEGIDVDWPGIWMAEPSSPPTEHWWLIRLEGEG